MLFSQLYVAKFLFQLSKQIAFQLHPSLNIVHFFLLKSRWKNFISIYALQVGSKYRGVIYEFNHL